MELRFDNSARQELDDAYHCSRMILRFPLVAPEIALGVRRALVPRFPYGILYRVHGEIIYVLAVMHLHRRPGYWQGR